jgi:hypothetical protein
MLDQIRCTGFASKSAILALSFVIVAVAQSAGAGPALLPDNIGPLPESSRMLAQAGSTGGVVGKQGKSVSGGEDAEPTRSAREHKQPEPRAKSRSPASYEGTWHGVSTGPCIHDYTWTLDVRNGIMSSSSAEGHVSLGGTTNGSMTVLGTRYVFKGRPVSRSAIAGTWTRPDGCSGKWTTNSISE